MATSDKNPVNIGCYIKKNQPGDTPADPPEKKDRPVSGADSELSRKDEELQTARKALEDIPDVREVKVARIKNRFRKNCRRNDQRIPDERSIKIIADILIPNPGIQPQ
jgi:anti-sigma28 factor (negative regulator of flagellin synthesis)